MEVINEKSAILSNFEVYSLLKETQEGLRKAHQSSLQNLATVVYEVSISDMFRFNIL